MYRISSDVREKGDDLPPLRLHFVKDLARAHVVKTWVHTTLVERNLAIGLHRIVVVEGVEVVAAVVSVVVMIVVNQMKVL